jgi:dimethylaniline monooxygenase (N-oxide forming)
LWHAAVVVCQKSKLHKGCRREIVERLGLTKTQTRGLEIVNCMHYIMKTVGVIGTGPAGLAAMKELKEAGFQVRGLDRHSRVGGRWAQEQNEGGVYKELYLNISKRNMAFSDFPWEEDNIQGNNNYEAPYAGVFAHNTEASAYLQAYAEHNELLPHIELETEVISIQGEDGSWTVTTKGTKNGREAEHKFDAIVICSGLFAKPKNPLKDFFKDFTGTVEHSAQVRSVKNYKGQRVLVVGSDISGTDMCCSLSTYGDCAGVVNSIRKAPYYTTKVSPISNKPIDDILGIRLPAWLSRILPYSLSIQGLRSVILQGWPNQPPTDATAGLERPEDLGHSGFSLSADFVDQLEAGKIRIKPGLASAEGKKVTFQDGTSEEFDAVICATGYEMDLSFLPQEIQDQVGYINPNTGAKIVKLYKHTLVPGMQSLAFAGYFHNAGGHFPMAEMQARYIAAIFSEKIPRPSDSKLQAGADQIARANTACPFNQYDSSTDVCESLGDELAVTPSLFQAFWSPKKLLFSPVYPCYYRTNPAVDGKEMAERFSKLFLEYTANPTRPVL